MSASCHKCICKRLLKVFRLLNLGTSEHWQQFHLAMVCHICITYTVKEGNLYLHYNKITFILGSNFINYNKILQFIRNIFKLHTATSRTWWHWSVRQSVSQSVSPSVTLFCHNLNLRIDLRIDPANQK